MDNEKYLEALLKLQELIINKATAVQFKCQELKEEQDELLDQEKAIQRAIDEVQHITTPNNE